MNITINDSTALANSDGLWRQFHRLAPDQSVPDELQSIRQLPDHLLTPYQQSIQRLAPCLDRPKDLLPIQRFFRYEMWYRTLVQSQYPPPTQATTDGFGLSIERSRFHLDRLKQPCPFLTDPDDGITATTIRQLTLEWNQEQIIVTVQPDEDYQGAIHERLDGLMGVSSAYYHVVAVQLGIEFYHQRTLDIDLALSEQPVHVPIKTAEDCLIWHHYLEQWGLLHPVAAIYE